MFFKIIVSILLLQIATVAGASAKEVSHSSYAKIEQRLKPLLTGALELLYHYDSISDDRKELYYRQFSNLESLLGNTESFVTVVRRTETIGDVALTVACELIPEDCTNDETLRMIANLEGFTDNPNEYRFMALRSDDSIKQVIFLDEYETNLNERFRVALMAVFNEYLNDKAKTLDEIPLWWRHGQVEYLTKMLEAYMSSGELFTSFHKRLSSSISGLASDSAPLNVMESTYKDISISAIIKLVHDFGMKQVFIDFYQQVTPNSTFDEAFQRQFSMDVLEFSSSLELNIQAGLDLSLIIEPNDIIDALEEPWNGEELTARSLFNLAPFKSLISLPYFRDEGCPFSFLMESHEFGDFNGDGYQDLIFTLDENDYWTPQPADRFCNVPTRVFGIFGKGDGGDPEAVVVDDKALAARDTAVADINGDGMDDLLIVGGGHKDESYAPDSPSISSISLYLGSENGLIKQTSTLDNRTLLDLGDMTGHYGTHGDIDGDGIPEFFLFGNGKNKETGENLGWPVPILIDCDELCIADHPVGFDIVTRPEYRGVSIYNGALLDLDGNSEIDILMNVEVPNYLDEEQFVSKRYAHAAYFQMNGEFDMTSPPLELDMGFRLDSNTIAPIPDDDRVLDMNATHYWETELVNLVGNSEDELVTLENNQFHVENDRFLISIYSRDPVTNEYTLNEHQPTDTKQSHDQNFQFKDLDGDFDLDIVSTLTGRGIQESISLHKHLSPGWSLSTKNFLTFIQEHGCNRVYAPDLDSDGNLDIVFFCNNSNGIEIYYGENLLPADRDNDSITDENDSFPLISVGSLTDTDNDGAPDNCDQACVDLGMSADIDDDNDGVEDSFDAFPLDANESQDTDSDGIGNNADTDDDNDGVLDDEDDAPLDPTNDTDGDGTSNQDDAFPQNHSYSLDSDSDGMPDSWEILYGLDPNDPSDASSDRDNDGYTAFEEFLNGTVPSGSIDIDGNERYDALTDGLLILRSMFGLDGSSLTAGTAASDAVYSGSDDLIYRINTLGDLADVDGSGDIDALTDGLLILRHLFGLEGETLAAGVVSGDATRTTEEIEAHLNMLMPEF